MAKVETERFFGKKGIIIMMRDGNKMVSAIFKDKKNADKFNRNNPADVKKLLQLAKKTKFPKGIDEDTDVGHQDDEPNMLKSTALEIMEYGKKLMDKLDKYDDMEGEVDFPNWWQSKLTLAKDYLQKAYHYLDSEEKTSENIDRNFRSYDNDEEGDDEGPKDEGFASDAQRRAAFASGYKAKGKKGKKKKNESVNEKRDPNLFYVLFQKKGVFGKPAAAGYKTRKDAEDFAKSLRNYNTMILNKQEMKHVKGIDIKEASMDWEKNFKWANDKELKVISKFIWMNPKGIDGVIKMSKHKPFAFQRTIQKMAKKGLHEGKKRYNVMYGVGSSKYTVNFHNGKSKHKDGSDFFDIAIFKNKRDLAKKINDLTKKGYIYSYKEGVNEDDMVFDPKTKSFKIKSGSMDWEKNFKWANDKELKVISKFIFMNPKGISGVIKMSKHKPFAFRRTIQKMAKKGLHEASKEAMGIAGFTGTRGVAVDDFIKKNKIDARKLFNFVRKGNLRDRMDFVTAIAGKPNNKFHKMIVGRFSESVREDKSQITKIKKQAGKKEIKFYDILSKLEKKMGKKKYRDFLVKSLKDFKINGNHYDYRTNAAAEEKLFQLAK